MLINVKMLTIVCILTFMSMINFILSWVKHKKFYNLGALIWLYVKNEQTSLSICAV